MDEPRIRTLVVDDERLARTGLRAMLASDTTLDVEECSGGADAVRLIRAKQFDLVFLDIQMPKVNGLEVIEQVGVDRMPVTVFTTAFSEHAIAAFDACALDYVVKPIREARIAKALARAREAIRQRRLGHASSELAALLQRLAGKQEQASLPVTAGAPDATHARRLQIRSGRNTYYIEAHDVDWIEADGVYARLWVGVRSHLLRQSLSQLESTLEPGRFTRVHRSVLVNVERVTSIRNTGIGKYAVQLSTGTVVPLSRDRRAELHRRLRERG